MFLNKNPNRLRNENPYLYGHSSSHSGSILSLYGLFTVSGDSTIAVRSAAVQNNDWDGYARTARRCILSALLRHRLFCRTGNCVNTFVAVDVWNVWFGCRRPALCRCGQRRIRIGTGYPRHTNCSRANSLLKYYVAFHPSVAMSAKLQYRQAFPFAFLICFMVGCASGMGLGCFICFIRLHAWLST